MAEKWILLVSDDESFSKDLKVGISQLGQDYHVISARDEKDAFEKLGLQSFVLVIIDQLNEYASKAQFSHQVRGFNPEVRIIQLSTGDELEHESETSRLNTFRILIKPVEMDELLRVIQEAVGEGGSDKSDLLVLGEEDYRRVLNHLRELEKDIGGRCVLLTDGEGTIIAQTGNLKKDTFSGIASLLCGSIVSLAEAGRTIEEDENAIHLAYREGKSGNLYAINVGSKFLLIILVDPGPFSSRLGLVWYSAKHTAAALLNTLGEAHYANPGEMLGKDFETALNQEFDDLFRSENSDEKPSGIEPSSAQVVFPSRVTEPPGLISFTEAKRAGLFPQDELDGSYQIEQEKDETE